MTVERPGSTVTVEVDRVASASGDVSEERKTTISVPGRDDVVTTGKVNTSVTENENGDTVTTTTSSRVTTSGVNYVTVTTVTKTTAGAETTVVHEYAVDADGNTVYDRTTTTAAGADGNTVKTTETVKSALVVDGVTFYLDAGGTLRAIVPAGAKLSVKTVTYTGFYAVTQRAENPHCRISVSADGTITMTYKNGVETPLPAALSVVMQPRQKLNPDNPEQVVTVAYTSAELWCKVLPGGEETAASKWTRLKVLEGENLNLHAQRVPLKIFGSVTLPQMSSGDEAILLLRLVDADGNASGETLTEGEAEPVVTLPDSKTRTFTATGSEAEFENTSYSSPFLFRIRYTGKTALK